MEATDSFCIAFNLKSLLPDLVALQVYTASANLVRVTHIRAPRRLQHFRTYDEFLASHLEPDVVREVGEAGAEQFGVN
jgi:hypothetical protein